MMYDVFLMMCILIRPAFSDIRDPELYSTVKGIYKTHTAFDF